MRTALALVMLCGGVMTACSSANRIGDNGSSADAATQLGADVTDPGSSESEGQPGADAHQGTVGKDTEGVTTCTSDADCDDQNACTEDLCNVDGTCRQVALVGTPCDDGSACTTVHIGCGARARPSRGCVCGVEVCGHHGGVNRSPRVTVAESSVQSIRWSAMLGGRTSLTVFPEYDS